MAINRVSTKRDLTFTGDDSQKPFDDLESTNNVSSQGGSRSDDDSSNDSLTSGVRTITPQEIETLSHFQYDSTQDQLIGDRAIETTLNSLFLGEQHKMSSGAENIFFTNLGNNTNFFPMWGGLKDQSITANQGSSGFIPPSGRVYTDMFSLPLGGNPDPLRSIGYTGGNYFAVSIAGLGITTTLAEEVEVGVSLEYRLSVNGVQVYKQILPTTTKRYPNDLIEWFFDHPVEIHAGTTIFAEIRKVDRSTDTDYGVLQVRMGDDGTSRYQAIVHNRLFEDKDLELISPYLKYQAMDFGLDSTGSTVLLRDLSLGSEGVLVSHSINTLEAVANGSSIQVKVKGGKKVLIESLPINATSVDGSYVNSVLNQALLQLNDLFSATDSFVNTDTVVNGFDLIGNDLTLTLNNGTSYTTDVTSLGVDENNFVVSGSLSGSDLILTMDDASTVTVDASNLAIDENVTVTSGVVSGTDLVLTLSDSTTVTIDASTLGGSSSSGNPVVSGSVIGTNLVLVLDDASTVTIDASNMINGSSLSALGQNWFISYGANASTQLGNPTSGNLSFNNAPIYFGEKLEVGTEFIWTQYSLINHASVYMSIGVWAGATDDVTGGSSTSVTNWSTKFGFYYDKIMEDTSTLVNGGYSSKNTDLGSGSGAGTVYASGSIMRLVYGSDYRLRLYVNDTLTATTIVAETGNDLDIQLIASNNGVEFPNFIKRTTNWTIVHDLDNSENNDILNGIEEDTVLETNFEIEVGEKAMVNLSVFGRSHRIGLDYTGASSGNSNPYSDVESPIVYGTSEQIITQNAGEWSFNTSALYYTASGNGKWSVPSANAGMVSFRYHNDNSVDLYSETYREVIATKLTDLDGTPFKVTISANENVANYNDLPTVSKQTIGQSFQPRTTYAPNIVNQSVNATEGNTLNYQIVSTDYIVNQYVAENAPSWLMINQNTGVLSGLVPAYVGNSNDNIVVNCKAGNAVGGVTNFTVTINVLENTYTNTKSLIFRSSGNSYLTGLASNISALQRSGNGSGVSDAWSLSMWVKTGGGSSTQQLFHYGGNTTYTNGAISLMQQNINDLIFVYGSASNNIIFTIPNSLTTNSWTHLLLTYDGGTTGASSGSLGNYYSRFNCSINGVVQNPTFSQTNYGYTGSINPVNYFIGRGVSSSYKLQASRINQLAIWDSNQISNISDIYNSGSTQDLSQLSSTPSHYYEMESEVININDSIGSANLTGYNFSNSDLVTDAP